MALYELALASQDLVECHFYNCAFETIAIVKARRISSLGFHKATMASWLTGTTYVLANLNTRSACSQQVALHALTSHSQNVCVAQDSCEQLVCTRYLAAELYHMCSVTFDVCTATYVICTA